MKRSDIKRRPLADTVLNSLEPEAKEYREAYGVDRLYFVVSPNGRKRWEMRHKKADGKWTWLGLGGYPEYSAKRAREKVSQLTDLIEQGIDPIQHRHAAKNAAATLVANTFRSAAETWYEKKVKDSRSASTLEGMRFGLDKDILPIIGDKPVAEVTRKDCAHIQQLIEQRGALNIAKKVRGWLRQIFSSAVARGLCENNPASELLIIAATTPAKKPHPHLLEPELPAFLKAMGHTTSRLLSRTAAWMTIWTASRPGMVRHAEWSEIDMDQAIWVIPGSKMKMSRDHHTPLSTQAMDAIRQLHAVTGHGRYLFPGIGQTAVLSENSINLVFKNVGYRRKLVGHGTRHTASTLLREHGWFKDHVEAQLAHVEDGIGGVYNKARYLPQRRHMMQWYADYLEALAEGMTKEKADDFAVRVNAASR